jgi:RecB family exonuclease
LPWISGELFHETPGMPSALAREICGRVAAWSARLAGALSPESVAYGSVAAAGAFATVLSRSIEEAGLDPVPRVQLERMIDAVLADGIDASHAVPQAAAWSHVVDPGQVWNPAGSVVWWGCGSSGASRVSARWTDEEVSALRTADCAIEAEARALAREAAEWRRPVMNACQRAVLVVSPGAVDEDRHPLLHELSPLLDKTPAVRFRAERLLDTGTGEVAGRAIERALAPTRELPQPRRSWTVPAGSISRRPVEAATSIELLLGCPYAWSLRYAAGLRASRRSEVPRGETLLGLLAHALSAEIFQPGPPPKPAIARRLAEQRLPVLIDEMATPLRLPGAAADHARAIDRLPVAIEALATRLDELNAVVVGAEVEREASDVLEAGVALKGRIDLLIDATGRSPAVLDMKWSRTDRYRRRDIAEGRAVQLAVYGRLVGAEQVPAPAAYFMLAQARLLPADANLFGAAASPASPSLGSVWQAAKSSWSARMRLLESGAVDALSEELSGERRNEEAQDDGAPTVQLALETPCKFCDKTLLCGHARVS